MAETRYNTLHEILNCPGSWLAPAVRSSVRQPFQLVRTECPSCAASLFQAYGTKPVCLVRDLILARLVQPNVAYREAGGADTDRCYRVIEVVLVGTAHGAESRRSRSR